MAYEEITGCFYHKDGKQHIRNVKFDDSISISGTGVPTSSTAADFEGQTYIDKTNGAAYICISANKELGTYTWKEATYEGGTGAATLEYKILNNLTLAQLAAFIERNIDNSLIKYIKVKIGNSDAAVAIPAYTIDYSATAVTAVAATTSKSAIIDGNFSVGEIDRPNNTINFAYYADVNGLMSIVFANSPSASYKFTANGTMTSPATDTYAQTVYGEAATVTSDNEIVYILSYLDDGTMVVPA